MSSTFKRFIASVMLALLPFVSFAQIQLFSNNASSTTTTAVTTGSTSVTVTSGAGALFPTLTGGNWFIATLETLASGLVTSQEIVKVTAHSGDTFTMVRAQEGTTAQAFPTGSVIALLPTAGGLSQFQQASQVQSGSTNFAVDTGSVNAYSVTLTPTLSAHVVGAPIRFLASHTNTGSSTFNDGEGTGQLLTQSGYNLGANSVLSSHVHTAIWNGVYFVLLDPSYSGVLSTFQITYTDGTNSNNTLAYFKVDGPVVTLSLPAITINSASNTFFTGTIPAPVAANFPAAQSFPIAIAQDNGTSISTASAYIPANTSTISFAKSNGSLTSWTSGGTKTIGPATIVYRTY